MTATVLTIVAALIGLLVWWVRRRFEPRNEITRQKQENAEAVASGDIERLNRTLADRINRVRPQ